MSGAGGLPKLDARIAFADPLRIARYKIRVFASMNQQDGHLTRGYYVSW